MQQKGSFRGKYLSTTAGASQEAKAKTPYTIPLLDHCDQNFFMIISIATIPYEPINMETRDLAGGRVVNQSLEME